MRQKSGQQKPAAEQVIKDIRRATRKHHSAEDKIRIVLEGLRGEDSIAALCPGCISASFNAEFIAKNWRAATERSWVKRSRSATGRMFPRSPN